MVLEGKFISFIYTYVHARTHARAHTHARTRACTHARTFIYMHKQQQYQHTQIRLESSIVPMMALLGTESPMKEN